MLRSVIQEGKSVVEATFIEDCFNHPNLDLSSMKSAYVPAAIKTGGVEGVWVARRSYFYKTTTLMATASHMLSRTDWVIWAFQLDVHRQRGTLGAFIG